MTLKMNNSIDKKSLDLGCGACPRNPYNYTHLYGIDIFPQIIDNVVYNQANLALDVIPFEDNHFDCVSAFDFIEHIPRQILSLDTKKTRLPFIELMNEIWRVLKNDGLFYALTPAYPSAAAFQDPTHVNIITSETYTYFCGDSPMGRMYGFTGRFERLRNEFVVPKTGLTAENSRAKKWYNIEKRIINPSRLSHLVWEFKAIK
jgi:SAM-dependent methyltransferase